MDLATATMLLSSIANTGKLIEYATAIGKGVVKPSRNEAQRQAESFTAQKIARTDIAKYASTITINDKILDKIIEIIEDAGVEVIDILDKFDKLPPDRADARLKAARKKFCWGLHQYKFHNSGSLPPDMEDDWIRNMCYSYNFI